MNMDEVLALPPSIDLRTVARVLGIGTEKAYRYAAAGQFPGDPPLPVRKYGAEYRVMRPHLFLYLGLDPAMVAVHDEAAEDGALPLPVPADDLRGGLSRDAIRALYDAMMAAAQVLVDRGAVP
jgi:hypothetical protein